jgi:integrase/recombinase XerD
MSIKECMSLDICYELSLKRFIQWSEDRDITDYKLITRPVLESYQRHLYYLRKKNGQPLSMATQRAHLSAIRSFFKWLARDNHILYNPAAELELPKRQQKLPRAILSIDDVQLLLSLPDTATPQGIRDRAILETLYSTGIRRRELSLLKVQDIDFKAGTVFIRNGKAGYERLLPIGATALKWVDKYLYDTRPLFVIGPDEHILFLTDYGEPFIKTRLSFLVKKCMKKADINKEGAAHLLRHAMATHMLDNGTDVRHVQEMLGHQQLNTTQVYTRVAIRKLKEVHQRTHPIA